MFLAPRPASVMLSGALSVVLALSACNKPPQGAKMPGGGQMPPAEVGVVTLAAATVGLSTELPGRTAAYALAEIRPQVSGIVQQRLFAEGAEVAAGQSLYHIDSAMYQNAFDSAKAALARSEANALAARLKHERYRSLAAVKAVSQQEADDAEAVFKQTEAAVAADKAALDSARINLAYTQVASPIAGRIGKSAVTQGALVTANQPMALATVQQLNPIYVDLSQSVADLMRLRRDLSSGVLKRAGKEQASVKLLLEDGSAYPLEGKLAFSDLSVDANTGSVSLRAVFPNPTNELLPGMFVRAVLQTGAREQSILVPQQAVTRNSKGEAVVMVVGEEGKFAPRVIQTTQTVGDKWLVSDGLKPGEQIIVEGLQRLRPGVVIKPVPAGAASAPAGAASAPAAGR